MGSALADEPEAASSTQTTDFVPAPDALAFAQSHLRLAPVEADGDPFVASSSAHLPARTTEPAPKRTMSKLLKGKEREWNAIAERKGPLKLLDLPLDILREIIGQLPHTNDLTSLALCHSTLHNLAIPCIYSRFDIVWPDSNTQTEPRTGVDALTYGLATLVMHEDVFGEASWQRRERSNLRDPSKPITWRRRRRGNYYAQYTKKFSLGNGPLEYVQEYLITKEGGKMLGTLVALAVARMRNLETFVWDMPTGVLRDVWLALSSHADRDDDEPCRLERVWIRWHDNSQLDMMSSVPPPPHIPQVNIGPQNPGHNSAATAAQLAPSAALSSQYQLLSRSLDRVEHPTFSVLPPLKSLSVMDIDELPYLDEMSILIGRSQHKLRELRVGIAAQAEDWEWAQVWGGDTLQQVDYNSDSILANNIGYCRLGGVLGILVGRVFNMRNNSKTHSPSGSRSVARTSLDGPSSPKNRSASTREPPTTHTPPGEAGSSSPDVFTDALSRQSSPQRMSSDAGESSAASASTPQSAYVATPSTPPTAKSIPLRSVRLSSKEARIRGPHLDGKLRLEILELERVSLCVAVLQRAFDWSVLTSLTLLNCPNHEQLWKDLRHLYSPVKYSKSNATASTPSPSPYRRSSALRNTEYRLNLKKIHTNNASLALINFIKDALAPNSLEVFFLQEARPLSGTAMPIDTIFRGVIRRHRNSLKKLMIDSSDPRSHDNPEAFSTSTRWRRWVMNREILTFITSGKMGNLRELGFTVDYKDWHFFLQNLPSIPHIRSLYIPHVADHPHAHGGSDPRELALQIVDIVTLRPEIELCYVGIANKCYEILESKAFLSNHGNSSSSSGLGAEASATADGGTGNAWPQHPLAGLNAATTVNLPNAGTAGSGNANDFVIDEEDEDDDADNDPLNQGPGQDDDITQSESEEGSQDSFDSDDDDDNDEEWGSARDGIDQAGQRLRLREILFYDDKVAVFKARHGRL